jgi:predicted Fe-Mo cluster-binding NifX family protein
MSPHFGHCEYFTLFDVDEKSKKIISVDKIQSPEHQPGLLPKWLAERNVSVVVAGGMGPHAQEIFKQNNIKVVLGVIESNPEKVVLDYLNGQLTTGDNVCNH